MFFALKNEIKSLRFERRISEVSAFLNTLYKITNDSGKSNLRNPRRYCKEWQSEIKNYGIENFISNLSISKTKIFQTIDSFFKIIDEFAFLDESKQFQAISSWKEELRRIFDELIKEIAKQYTTEGSVDQYKEEQELTEREIKILSAKFETLNYFLDDYEQWLKDSIDIIHRQKKELYGIRRPIQWI
jgi:hypothetical protein